MRKLTIYKYYFTDSACYKAAQVQTQKGVQVHCTTKGASYLKRWVGPDDGRLGQNRYGNHHNDPDGDVCANAYIGKLADGTVACYQALPWDYRCWLSANGANGNANKLGYIGFEIAADNLDKEDYFQAAVMGVSVNLTAYLCGLLGVNPWDVVKSYKAGEAFAVMDHHELATRKLASGHADISHWLKRYNLTMDDYRSAVEAAMEEGVEVTYIDAMADMPPRTLRKGDRGTDVEELQRILNQDPRYPTKVDGIFGSDTEASVRAFQADHGLTADGIVGAKTWAKLREVQEPTEDDNGEKPADTEESSGETPSAVPDGSSPQGGASGWDNMTLEEKVEDLNSRLLAVEGGDTDG